MGDILTTVAIPSGTRSSTYSKKYAVMFVVLCIISVCIISFQPSYLLSTLTFKVDVNDNADTDDVVCDRPRPLPDKISYADLKHHSHPGLRPKVILVGMPKSGTTSLGGLFRSAGFSTCDFRCTIGNQTRVYIAACIRQAIVDGNPPFATCGDYEAYSQIDMGNPGGNCYFPAIQALEEIHKENPTAVLVLNLRNVTHWTSSVLHWPPYIRASDPLSLSNRLVKCEAGPKSTSPEALAYWYCEHTQRIREFVARHPSHTLVEVDIEDAASGEKLANFFGVDPSHWQQLNKNNKNSSK
jgi:hypothetical protein